MTTTIKVAFREQSKAVTAETTIESDDMTGEEVLTKSKELFDKAFNYSQSKTLKK